PFEQDQALNAVEEAESEIDPGVELYQPLDAAGDERSDTVLDIGVVLRDTGHEDEPDDGDFFGPTEEPSSGVEEFPSEGLADEAAAFDIAGPDLVLEELPPLDADDEGGQELRELFEGKLDEEPAAPAAEPWEFERASSATEPLFAVTLRDRV